MARLALLPLLLTGCFYASPINQRPSLEIASDGSTVHRGQTVAFHAVINDPEAELVSLRWAAYDCTDPSSFATCSRIPLTSTATDFSFVVDRTYDDDDEGTTPQVPVQGIRVTLDGRDARGAGAKPLQVLALPVENAAPEFYLTPNAQSDFGRVVGTPIRVYAEYFDADDTAANVTLEWHAYAPTEVEFDGLAPLANVPAPVIPGHRQDGRVLTPTVEGLWKVRITATDPLGNSVESIVSIPVELDQPPCLVNLAPIIAPTGAALPLTEPQLFQAFVSDDLDGYPASASCFEADPAQPTHCRPEFTWSLLEPGGTRHVVDAGPGNTLAFDPAAYPAGSRVEVRVEIADRNATPLACADGDPTCSVSSTACLQRQTWRMETR